VLQQGEAHDRGQASSLAGVHRTDTPDAFEVGKKRR